MGSWFGEDLLLRKCVPNEACLEVHGYFDRGVIGKVIRIISQIRGRISRLITTHEPPSASTGPSIQLLHPLESLLHALFLGTYPHNTLWMRIYGNLV